MCIPIAKATTHVGVGETDYGGLTTCRTSLRQHSEDVLPAERDSGIGEKPSAQWHGACCLFDGEREQWR